MLNPAEVADLIETATEYAGSLELEIERIISNADAIDNADPKLRALAAQVRRMAATLKKAGV